MSDDNSAHGLTPPPPEHAELEERYRAEDRAERAARQREYRRLKKLGGGDYHKGREIENAARRAQMTPYDVGREDAFSHLSAVAMYNARPPDICPYAKSSPEEAEYDRGWKATCGWWRSQPVGE